MLKYRLKLNKKKLLFILKKRRSQRRRSQNVRWEIRKIKGDCHGKEGLPRRLHTNRRYKILLIETYAFDFTKFNYLKMLQRVVLVI